LGIGHAQYPITFISFIAMTVVHNYVVDAVSVLSASLTIRVEIDFVFAYCCRPGFCCTLVNIELKVIQIVDQGPRLDVVISNLLRRHPRQNSFLCSLQLKPTPKFILQVENARTVLVEVKSQRIGSM